MKKIMLTIVTGLSLATAMQSAPPAEHRREIPREFQTGDAPQLTVDNRHGNIRIIEGQENRILFKIEITAKAKSEEQAREIAESISVDFSQTGDRVSAKTRMGNLNCNNCRIAIHYTVVAPRSAVMQLSNRHGDIILNDAVKPLEVDLAHGDLEAGTLDRATVSLQHGKATIQAAAQLKIDTRHSRLDLGTVEQLETDVQHGQIRVNSAGDFILHAQHTGVTIDRLRSRLAVEGTFSHGSLDIDAIDPEFSQIKIKAAHSGLRIALTRDHHFRANLSTRHGSIHAGETTFNDVNLQERAMHGNSITGTANTTGSPAATVDISNSHGDIVFK